MKKLTFSFLTSIFLVMTINAQVIFDPATFNGNQLPAGMTIVTIDGSKYLQVMLNGWSNILSIPTVVLYNSSTRVSAEMKYGVGGGGYTLDQIKNVVQIMDTINKMDDQWNPGNLVPSSTAVVQEPASNFFSTPEASLNTVMKEVHQLQFFGQETTNWGPLYGDTIFVGKVEAFGSTELLTNGGFDNIEGPLITRTANEWGMWTQNGGYAEINNGVCTVYPITDAVNNWSMQVEQWNFYLENNKTYTASFEAWSDANRVICLTIEDPANGYTMLGHTESPGAYDSRSKWDIPITTQPTVYRLAFTVDGMKSNSDTKFAFLLAQSEDIVYLDNVSLQEGILDGVEVVPQNWGTVLYTGFTPVIDGYEESQYKAGGTNKFARLSFGNVVNESDNSGYFRTLWDYNYLYYFAHITDDDPIPFVSGELPYLNDGIEIWIDSKNRHLTGPVDYAEQQVYRINPGALSPIDLGSRSNWLADNDTTDIYFATVNYGDYYTVEAAIPWATIFRTEYNTNLDAVNLANSTIAVGYNLGFESQLFDASALNQRKSILSWANSSGEDMDYQSSQYWGMLTLEGSDGILSDLTVNGATVDGFHPNVPTYLVILPMGSTEVPPIGWETFDPGASYTYQYPTDLHGKTQYERSFTITVFGSSSAYDHTYTVEFYTISNDAVLSGVKINNVDLPGFYPDVTSYQYELPLNTVQVPEITCQTAVEGAKVRIENPTNLFGTEQERTATITVTSVDGKSTKTYTILLSVKGLDIQSSREKEIKVFPSPAGSYITIQNLEGAKMIQVFDISGKLRLELNEINPQQVSVDVTSLSSSIYFVKVLYNNKVVVKKFLKH